MEAKDFIAKQRKVLAEIIEKDKPLQIAVKTVVAAQATRIFVEGKNSSDSIIGQYDTETPLYINPNKAPRKSANKPKGIEGLLPPRGKHGDTHFKDGKPHKTTYVNNYKDLRNRMGRRIDRVDAFYSGDLKSDFSNSTTNTVVPRKVDTHQYISGLKRQDNVDKKEGLEKKYGEIFPHTEKEKQLFFSTAQKEFQLILTNA